jgi:hypothetical protein
MTMTLQCFTIEELEPLDEGQRTFLRNAIEREIRTNPEILRIIKEKFEPLRTRMAAQPRARRSRSARGA